ncbi:hypothetical protein [Methanosarcina hadiensis]|uniref:hypothetical protein n=1 Tax=Methanosarcina hadiensis TaxID=3078083 RepID=UPI003977C45F
MEFRGDKGAEVVYDAPHPERDPDLVTISHILVFRLWEINHPAGERENITYEGP